jgi:hypothetical protein
LRVGVGSGVVETSVERRMGSEGTGVTSESELPCTESRYPRKGTQAGLVHSGGVSVASVVWK